MSILYYLYLRERVKKYIYYRQYRHIVGVLSASKIKKSKKNLGRNWTQAVMLLKTEDYTILFIPTSTCKKNSIL